MSAPALRSDVTDVAAPPPVALRARPGIRRVMVSGLRANVAKGRLHLNADVLVREGMPSSERDVLEEVLNYEIVVDTLRRAALLDSSLDDLAQHACMECFKAVDVVEVRIEAVSLAGAAAESNTAVAHRVRSP